MEKFFEIYVYVIAFIVITWILIVMIHISRDIFSEDLNGDYFEAYMHRVHNKWESCNQIEEEENDTSTDK